MEVSHWEQEDAGPCKNLTSILTSAGIFWKSPFWPKKAIPRNPCLQGPTEWQKQYMIQKGWTRAVSHPTSVRCIADKLGAQQKLLICHQWWCYRFLLIAEITYRAVQREKSGRGRWGFNTLHRKSFLTSLCFSKIDFTWCEWKNGKLRKWDIQNPPVK